MTKTSMRGWVGAAVIGLVTVAVGVSGGAASATPRGAEANRSAHRYVALGDSITLGYSPLLEEPWDPERFVGYPEIIEQATQMSTTNLACPGQTAQALVSRDAVDAGCFEAREEAQNDGSALLHDDYEGTQLDAALAAVRSAQRPELISIQGGGNEVSICGDAPNPNRCLHKVLPKVTKSLNQAATELRAAGFTGRLVIVGYHLVPDLRAPLRLMNAAIERAARQAHVAFANAAVPFDRYAKRHHGDLCETGLLVKLPDGSCDLHPTVKGQRLIAAAILKAAPASAR